jgi:hypothetical protein
MEAEGVALNPNAPKEIGFVSSVIVKVSHGIQALLMLNVVVVDLHCKMQRQSVRCVI